MESIAKTCRPRKIPNLSVCGSDFVSAFGRWRVEGCWVYGRGGMRQARTFGSRTRTFCSVPEHFVPCTNKMFFFGHFLQKKLFNYFLRSQNYLLSPPNYSFSCNFSRAFTWCQNISD
jgi:hypothetical protein